MALTQADTYDGNGSVKINGKDDAASAENWKRRYTEDACNGGPGAAAKCRLQRCKLKPIST